MLFIMFPTGLTVFHFHTAERLQKIIIGVGNEFNSTDTALFDPTSFTQCVNHPGLCISKCLFQLIEVCNSTNERTKRTKATMYE